MQTRVALSKEIIEEKYEELGCWKYVSEFFGYDYKYFLQLRDKIIPREKKVDPNRPKRPGRPRKYAVNENYFEKIDTEEKAYILGFLTGDGHVDNREATLRIALQVPDRAHLEKILKSLESNYPITERELLKKKTNKISRQCEVNINSKKMVSALHALGFSNNKTHDATPVVIDEQLVRHYFRGLIDADGSLMWLKPDTKRNRKTGKWRIGLVGTQPIIAAFVRFVEHNTGIQMGIETRTCEDGLLLDNATTSGVAYVQKIAHLFYKNATIWLDRKYSLYKKISETKILHKDRSYITKEKILEYRVEGKSWYRIAKIFGVDQWTLHNICKKFNLK